MVSIICSKVSKPTTSTVRKVAELARPKFLAVTWSTTSKGIPISTERIHTAIMANTPIRLAIKFGVSLASITLLPRLLTRKVSKLGITRLSIRDWGINSINGI